MTDLVIFISLNLLNKYRWLTFEHKFNCCILKGLDCWSVFLSTIRNFKLFPWSFFFAIDCLSTINIFVVSLKNFVPIKVPEWKFTLCIHRIAAIGEWHLLYSVAKDKDGLLQREIVRGLFDASLFERLQDSKKSSWVLMNGLERSSHLKKTDSRKLACYNYCPP